MSCLPPGQQLVSGNKWPLVGERQSGPRPPIWKLEVQGLVDRPTCLTLNDLQSLPQTRRSIDIHCVTRWSKLGVEFLGVSLRDLMAEIGVSSKAKYVSFAACSDRKHSSSLELSTALELETLLAWQVDGQPLPDEHGGPLRNIVPNRYFYKSVKWLCGVEFLLEDKLGYWEADAGYHNLADPWQEQRYIAANIDKRTAKQMLETRDLRSRDLRGFQGDGVDLSGLLGCRAILRDASFRRAQLSNADFSQANLSNAHFENANLLNASFVEADVEGANFCGAEMRGCDFRGASLFGASFVVENWQDLPESEWHAARVEAVHLTPQQVDSLTTHQAAYWRRFCHITEPM
ncbi:MAG: molybdopterin-dependent oxidoreductase [Planctomycetaceae bacterium]|nr:molybdopterin-dependent oxidoreductase [Planctomycetaceae bacterium]